MKTKNFPLVNLISEHGRYDFDNSGSVPCRIYKIPTLSAYAIQSSNIEGAPTDVEECAVGTAHTIEGDILYWFGDTWRGLYGVLKVYQPYVRVTYIGIKDYRDFFAFVKDGIVRQRLADMFEEAESAFENQMWFCYTIVAGAVCEGILLSVLQAGRNAPFKRLIERAAESKTISSTQASTLHKVRKLRNKIHPYNFEESDITRPVAMELKILIDELLIEDWESKGVKFLVKMAKT